MNVIILFFFNFEFLWDRDKASIEIIILHIVGGQLDLFI